MATKKRTEFEIGCAHKSGELARILGTLSKGGVNVLAFCGHGHEDKATVLLVSKTPKKAAAVLKTAGIAYKTNPVVAVTGASGAGEGAALARKLAEAKLNVDYAYASTSGRGKSTAVFRIKDVERAVKALA